MKKFLTSILIIIITFSLCDTTFAGEITQKEEAITYTIIVNDTVLDLSNLPLTPYEKIGTVIIPLRQTSEALGYKVDWNAETMSITIDDGYIQKATLYNKTPRHAGRGVAGEERVPARSYHAFRCRHYCFHRLPGP